MWTGHGLSANNYGTRLHSYLVRRFSNLHGSQSWNATMICWGLGGFGLGVTGVLDANTKEDLGAHAQLVLLWGANLASQPNTGRHLAAARRRGAHVVTIDVRETEAARQSDEVIVLRPGTDAALALAMMHVIVAENLHDRAFVAQHTVGFDELAAHVREYTPAWAAAVTGVSVDRIVALARRYAATRARDDRDRRQLHVQGHGGVAGESRDLVPARADRQPRHPRRRLRPAPRRGDARSRASGRRSAAARALRAEPDVAHLRRAGRRHRARPGARRHGHDVLVRGRRAAWPRASPGSTSSSASTCS